MANSASGGLLRSGVRIIPALQQMAITKLIFSAGQREIERTAFRCQARLKAQAEAWREISKKLQAKDKQPATFTAPEEEPEAGSSEMEVDTSLTPWTKNLEQQSSDLGSLEDDRFESPEPETSEIYVDESQNHTKKY